jgi:hypothetical protein
MLVLGKQVHFKYFVRPPARGTNVILYCLMPVHQGAVRQKIFVVKPAIVGHTGLTNFARKDW